LVSWYSNSREKKQFQRAKRKRRKMGNSRRFAIQSSVRAWIEGQLNLPQRGEPSQARSKAEYYAGQPKENKLFTSRCGFDGDDMSKRKRHAVTPCQKADPNDRKITCGSPRGHIGPCQWARVQQSDWKTAAANDRDEAGAPLNA
jgi:hypothetical protein